MQHQLSLLIPPVTDLTILRVCDTSTYSSLVPFSCPILSITYPGYPNSTQITTLGEGFNANLTACDLNVQTALCGIQYNQLIDGIYIINWSVSPNGSVFVNYNHLRVTNWLLKYNKALCELELSTCDPSQEVHKKYERLQHIKMYCDAAIAQAEFAHNSKHGSELFLYSTKLLDRYLRHQCRGI